MTSFRWQITARPTVAFFVLTFTISWSLMRRPW
jgi:hypothetical protein